MTHDAFPDDPVSLLERARRGDDRAFDQLVTPHRRELLAHCYRMLSSAHDAEDAVQDTFLRAWRSLERFEARSSVRTWLFKIATNVCLNRIERIGRRYVPTDEDRLAAAARIDPTGWIEPFPSRDADVEAEIDRRESVELAFVAAVQHLPATQRAVLLLRDVLAFSAVETATLLDVTEATVTSRLQRARENVRGRIPSQSQRVALARLGDERVRDLAARYVAAWEHQDAAALVELVTDDVVFSMPPQPVVIHGVGRVGDFLAAQPMRYQWRVAVTRANGQLAFAAYLLDTSGQWAAHSIDVVEIRGEKISSITAFGQPDLLALFGFPATLEAGERPTAAVQRARPALLDSESDDT
jgi:RNA polymerase sigma-70 factor (TIGR02960 family)